MVCRKKREGKRRGYKGEYERKTNEEGERIVQEQGAAGKEGSGGKEDFWDKRES